MTGKPPRRPMRPAAPAPDADAPPMADDAQPWKKRRAPRKPATGRRRDGAETAARAKAAAAAPAPAAPPGPEIAFNEPGDPAARAAIAALRAAAAPDGGPAMAAHHKTGRLCFGAPIPAIDGLAKDWRAALADGSDPLAARLALAANLWDAGGFETRIAAAKLLTQARIAGDGPVWDLIRSWVPQFDGSAIADAVAAAGSRRLAADPARLDDLEGWTGAAHVWTRRAPLVFTLPFAKARATPAVLAAREKVLGWAARYVDDRDRFVQKALGEWLRSLSVHDPDRVRAFMDAHGGAMKSFARKEALRLIA